MPIVGACCEAQPPARPAYCPPAHANLDSERLSRAAGVQIGTAYLLCPESTISPVYRAALQSEAARHTALTNVITGRPARGIVNRIIRELGPLRDDLPPFPLATPAVMPLRSAAEAQGSGDFSPLWSGENASRCRAIPAAEVTRALAEGWRRTRG